MTSIEFYFLRVKGGVETYKRKVCIEYNSMNYLCDDNEIKE